VAGGRLIVLDEGLAAGLAAELRARGRAAATVAELGLVGATDAEVLGAVAARGGVLVATHHLGAPPLAVIAAADPAQRRDAVHRHAAAIATQRGGIRVYR
jgi:hypothetical protein